MKTEELQRRLNEVQITDFKVFFTKKYINKLEKAFKVMNSIGPKEVKLFIWPKVTVKGPAGEKEYPLTWMCTGRMETKVIKKGDFTSWEKIVLQRAVGKLLNSAKQGKQRGLVRDCADLIQYEVDKKFGAAAYRKDFTRKTQMIWRRFQRKTASKDLFDLMWLKFENLTDYDVKETWKEVKNMKAVRKVMDS